jgi:hypothetical protein
MDGIMCVMYYLKALSFERQLQITLSYRLPIDDNRLVPYRLIENHPARDIRFWYGNAIQ